MPVCQRLFSAIVIVLLSLLQGSPAPAKDASGGDPDALFAMNRFAEARVAYKSALKQEPSRLPLHLGLVRTLLRLDRWQEAVEAARAATKSAPKSADAEGMLALALMRAGQPDEAASAVGSAVALEGNKISGDLTHSTGSPVAVKSDSYWTLSALGCLANWNGQEALAMQALRRATTLQPEWPEAWYFLVSLTTSKSEVTAQDLEDLNHYLKLHARGQPHSLAQEELPSRLTLIRTYVSAPPYQALEPISEAQYQEADQGTRADFTVTLPIERAHGYVIVPVQLEGKKLRLLLDTGGGSDITLNQSTVEALKLQKLADSEVVGVSGKEPAKLYLGKRLTLGGQSFGPIPIVGVKSAVGPFDGIMGVSPFDHDVVTIDLQHNRLTLSRGKTAMAPPAAPGNRLLVVPFHYFESNVLIPLSMGNQPTWSLVDTGFDGYSTLSLRLARQIAAGRRKGTYAETDIDGKFGIGADETKQRALGFVDPVPLKIAGSPASGGDLIVPMKDAFGISMLDKRISPSTNFELGSLLGISFLMTAERITIDYPHRLLTLERRTREP